MYLRVLTLKENFYTPILYNMLRCSKDFGPTYLQGWINFFRSEVFPVCHSDF